MTLRRPWPVGMAVVLCPLAVRAGESSTTSHQAERGFAISLRVRFDDISRNMTVAARQGEFLLRIDPAGEGSWLSFFVNIDGKLEPRVRGIVPELGRWRRVAASWDGRTASLWIDGVRFWTPRPGRITPTDNPLVIGKASRWGPADLVGQIADVRLHDHALTEADVARLMPRARAPSAQKTSVRPQVAVYYFPQWHVDPSRRRQHGRGWTEWDIIRGAKARFPGHQQPKVPAWGYEMEDEPKAMARKIAAAADHGIDAFLFDWYYHEQGPFLHRALEQGFLRAANASRLKFAVMWANHSVGFGKTRRKGAVPEKVFVEATDRMIERYFRHPSYWRVAGGLFVSIYQVHTLANGLGGVDRAAHVLARLRQRVRAAGLGELHLNAISQRIRARLSDEDKARYTHDNAVLAQLGFDSVTTYHWVHHQALTEFPATDYAAYRDQAMQALRRYELRCRLPYFPCVAMGWDPSPRTRQGVPYERKGYPWTAVLVDNTPAQFKRALEQARDWLAEPGRRGPPVLLLNAWNEWGEGSYLEPDTRNDMQYLEAIRAVFGVRTPSRPSN